MLQNKAPAPPNNFTPILADRFACFRIRRQHLPTTLPQSWLTGLLASEYGASTSQQLYPRILADRFACFRILAPAPPNNFTPILADRFACFRIRRQHLPTTLPQSWLTGLLASECWRQHSEATTGWALATGLLAVQNYGPAPPNLLPQLGLTGCYSETWRRFLTARNLHRPGLGSHKLLAFPAGASILRQFTLPPPPQSWLKVVALRCWRRILRQDKPVTQRLGKVAWERRRRTSQANLQPILGRKLFTWRPNTRQHLINSELGVKSAPDRCPACRESMEAPNLGYRTAGVNSWLGGLLAGSSEYLAASKTSHLPTWGTAKKLLTGLLAPFILKVASTSQPSPQSWGQLGGACCFRIVEAAANLGYMHAPPCGARCLSILADRFACAQNKAPAPPNNFTPILADRFACFRIRRQHLPTTLPQSWLTGLLASEQGASTSQQLYPNPG